ncbi:MAG: SDR family NAD(P)-dependent oxidoreductase [Ignavibacteria bacterium]|nr:SDR family NAD(P)-dependent oxidoreductase [Ignavibacteria bacterium]
MDTLTVLITGASSGIGEACAEVFARNGHKLILWARRIDRLNSFVQRASSATGQRDNILVQSVDVRDRANVQQAINSWLKQGNAEHIDVLINNAGLSRGLAPFHEGSYEDWDEMIDTNIKGLINVSREIIPMMVTGGGGTVVNIASIAGRQAYRGGNVYSTTKAAVKMLSDSLQIDLNGTGVRVCNVDPGLVETEFSEVRFRGDKERAANVYKGYTPLSAMDVADVVYFVATRPRHVAIQDVLITPTDQASVNIVNKH